MRLHEHPDFARVLAITGKPTVPETDVNRRTWLEPPLQGWRLWVVYDEIDDDLDTDVEMEPAWAEDITVSHWERWLWERCDQQVSRLHCNGKWFVISIPADNTFDTKAEALMAAILAAEGNAT